MATPASTPDLAPRSILRLRLLQITLSALAFALLNKIGFYFQIDNGVSIFYPATAVDVIACMHYGIFGAIGILIGALLTPWQPDETLLQTFISGMLNVSEGMIPYLVFKARKDLYRDLHDLRSLGVFVAVGTVLNSAVSAILGNLLLIPRPASGSLLDFRSVFMWWVSDFSAAVLLGIPLLAFAGDLFAKISTLPRPKAQRTIANAIEITAVIILLGWSASTAIQTYLAERMEKQRLEEQKSLSRSGRHVSEIHRNFMRAWYARVNGNEDPATMAALQYRNRELLGDLAAAADVRESRPKVQDLAAGLESWFGDRTQVRPHDRSRIEESILELRSSLEARGVSLWSEYAARRERIALVIMLMNQMVLLILLLASVNLLYRISRPLNQLHEQVSRLRQGDDFDTTAVETDLLELRTLTETIGETSRELAVREEALREQTERALAASKAKSDFLAKMSHEFRTPLNAIIGFSDILLDKRDAVAPSRREAFLDNIVRSGRHLLRLVNDLLDVAKIESGKIVFRFEPVDVRELIDNSVGSMLALFRQRNQSIETRLPSVPITLHVDAGRIEQVFLNLLSNANKFSPDGSVITISAAVEDDICRVDVRDEGIGIREEDQDFIFEEFSQVNDGTLPKTPGTGLGLALARRLVEAHGGRITVSSRLGGGSTFRVELPLKSESSLSATA